MSRDLAAAILLMLIVTFAFGVKIGQEFERYEWMEKVKRSDKDHIEINDARYDCNIVEQRVWDKVPRPEES